MIQGRGRLRTAAGGMLLVTLTLSGCTASTSSPGARSGAASSSSAPSPQPSPDPVEATPAEQEAPAPPRPPKARKGPAGQQAFAAFVMDAWSWSLGTNDAAPLLNVSPSRTKPCAGCRDLDRELGARAREGWHVDFPGLTVERTRLRRTADGDVVATSKVAIPESISYHDDGSYRSTSPGHDDATFTVTMRLVKGSYRLVSFAVG